MEHNPSSASAHASDSDSVSLILTACAIGLLLTLMVYSRSFVFGSDAGHWIYPYLEAAPAIPRWIPFAALLSLGLSIFIGGRLIHTYEKATLFACFLNAILLQALLHKAYGVSLGAIVRSDVANSFYTSALKFSALDILAKFDRLLPSLANHARSNMPGKILLFEVLKQFTSSPEVMGYMIIGLSSLGGLLLYGICKQLFRDRQAAFYALVLYALVPGKIFFFPILNTVTPVFILVCLYLFLMYIERKQTWIPWLLGTAVYLLFLFEASPATLGILFLGILIHAIGENRLSEWDLWKFLTHLVLAFLAVYAAFSALFHFSLLQAFLYVLEDAVKFNLISERGYAIWAGENILEFFFSAGVPVMIIFMYMAAHILGDPRTLKDILHWSSENVYVICLLLTFLAVDLLGINRGEVTRLWIYLAVFFQVPASLFIARIHRGEILLFLVSGTLVLQSLISLHRVGFVLP